jgi:hypothetical protein
MSIKSNIYAEKIFAEHPIGLWSLDDNVDYLSLITESQRNIINWDFLDATVISSNQDINKPFSESIQNRIEFDDFLTPSKEIKFVGDNLISLDELNFELATLTAGCYFYTESAYLKSISIGFEYTDTSSAEIIEKVTKYSTSVSGKWIFISHTSTFPNQDTFFRPVLKVEFQGGAASTDSYRVFTNGFTIAQCSENFNTTSLGQSTSIFPSTISLSGVDSAINLNSYSLGIKNGHYLVNNNTLYSKNTSIPIVYGSDSITKIIPFANNPSLIIPGFGFLNEIGRYREYTLEMWMRINCDSTTPVRIFGPISSTDGIYVEDGFITLAIGKYFGSHYIGEWYRPMLIQIRFSQKNASLLINGEEVISLNIDSSLLDLPTEFDENNKEQDWLGFYSYSDTAPYEIDCVAIYSYLIPDIVAKRRWVYGQAVTSPEIINSAYGASSAYIDYPFSEYTANYTYPSIGRWVQATSDNMSSTENTLSIAKYNLPTLFLDEYSEQKFIDDNKARQDEEETFFTFRPNEDWNDKKTYAYFDNFSTINEDIHGLCAVIQFEELINNVQTIFEIYNVNNKNYFKATLENGSIKYYFCYNENINILNTVSGLSTDTYIPVGFRLDKMINYFGSNLSTFFGSRGSLRLYIGSNDQGIQNFEGKFYKFHILSNYNSNLISDLFLDNGLSDTTKGNQLLSHTGTYTLIPELKYDKFYLDTASAGYWEDYIPLSYFGTYINDPDGNKYYDLDFLQFNIDYPSPTKVYSTEVALPPAYLANGSPNPARGDEWDYIDVDLTYDHTVQRTYAQFDNALFSGWENYEDIEQKSIKSYFYNTDNSSVRSYISIQYIESGANKNINDFAIVQPLRNDKILNISNYTNWRNTVFEVADNTIIYPPSGVDFNSLAIVTHLVFNLRGTQNKNITLKKLEIASQAFDHNSATKIGTRFGIPIYPYKKTGIYYDYKAKNPISIFKESVPYLYSTRKSGIEIRGSFHPYINRGVAVPINRSVSNNYKVTALQMWLRYDFDKFTYGPTQVFELEHKYDTIKFFIKAISEKGDRGKIFAINKSTGQEVNGLAFYINGALVKDPVIEAKEWSVIGVSFANSINMDNFLGSINLNGPFVFNSIVNYQSTALQDIQSKVYRPWLRVKNDGVSNLYWTYWYTSYNWDGVLVVSTSELYGVNPAEVYETYIGRNKFIVDSNTNESLNFVADSIKMYVDTSWQAQTATPV